MCSDRLAGGEAPACVQGCPNQAIRIRLVDTSRRAGQRGRRQLPARRARARPHRPDHRLPAASRPRRGNLLPADFYSVSPEHSHPPLVVMLVLTQLAVGAFAGVAARPAAARAAGRGPAGRWRMAALALALGLLALGASVFHLGRPLYAWRAFLGLRTSWLSREALAFGLFAKLGAPTRCRWPPPAGCCRRFPGGSCWPRWRRRWRWRRPAVGPGGRVLLGDDLRRHPPARTGGCRSTAAKFFGTTVVLGAATLLLVVAVAGGGCPGFLDGAAAPRR